MKLQKRLSQLSEKTMLEEPLIDNGIIPRVDDNQNVTYVDNSSENVKSRRELAACEDTLNNDFCDVINDEENIIFIPDCHSPRYSKESHDRENEESILEGMFSSNSLYGW